MLEKNDIRKAEKDAKAWRKNARAAQSKKNLISNSIKNIAGISDFAIRSIKTQQRKGNLEDEQNQSKKPNCRD